jgi:hypothetical protein
MVGTIDSAVQKGRGMSGDEGPDQKENGETPEDAAVDEREAEPEPAGVSG